MALLSQGQLKILSKEGCNKNEKINVFVHFSCVGRPFPAKGRGRTLSISPLLSKRRSLPMSGAHRGTNRVSFSLFSEIIDLAIALAYYSKVDNRLPKIL